MATVTRSEFEDWLEHPVTRTLKDTIRKDVVILQDMLLNTGLDELKELQGRCKVSINFLNMTYEDLYE